MLPIEKFVELLESSGFKFELNTVQAEELAEKTALLKEYQAELETEERKIYQRMISKEIESLNGFISDYTLNVKTEEAESILNTVSASMPAPTAASTSTHKKLVPNGDYALGKISGFEVAVKASEGLLHCFFDGKYKVSLNNGAESTSSQRISTLAKLEKIGMLKHAEPGETLERLVKNGRSKFGTPDPSLELETPAHDDRLTVVMS